MHVLTVYFNSTINKETANMTMYLKLEDLMVNCTPLFEFL